MNRNLPNSFRSGPDERGHFGIFGGRFVAETLMPLILDLEKAYAEAKADPAFQAEMDGYLKHYVGRPSPLYFAERLTEHRSGANIYSKREELNDTRAQMHELEGRLPDSLIACIGGGSNAMGLFHPFLDDPGVEIFGVEAAGHGLTQLHAASIAGGRPGVLHGNRTYLLMDDDGQIQDAHSISAGLDYPGIGPEHSWLHETGRVKYLSATDDEALAAFQLLSRLEGIIPALEPAHAIAKVMELAPRRAKDHLMVINLSGRGDKDVPQVGDILKGKKK